MMFVDDVLLIMFGKSNHTLTTPPEHGCICTYIHITYTSTNIHMTYTSTMAGLTTFSTTANALGSICILEYVLQGRPTAAANCRCASSIGAASCMPWAMP